MQGFAGQAFLLATLAKTLGMGGIVYFFDLIWLCAKHWMFLRRILWVMHSRDEQGLKFCLVGKFTEYINTIKFWFTEPKDDYS
jgi:hypothetical protein